MQSLFVSSIIVCACLLSWPLGRVMAGALNTGSGESRFSHFFAAMFLRLGGRMVAEEQDWKQYSFSLILFNCVMFSIVVVILSMQHLLPLNPDGKGPLSASLIFHTASSFVTNTNQQHYSGEVSMSYFSQIFGLIWLQFMSAATGIAALAALARGLSGRTKLGNFFRDLLRATFLVMLPLAVLEALILTIGGAPMTLEGVVHAQTLEGAIQTISRGPVAAFVAVKQLGTNGGGFFGANSSHPFENPSFATNAIESVSILLIPMAAVWMFGRVTGRMRHAAIIFAVMLTLLATQVGLAVHFENAPAIALSGLSVAETSNWEGKELRFGFSAAPLWGVLTTATSNGSVNSMLDSFNPLTGLFLFVGMWLNVAFGGVGVGLMNMFTYIIAGVFVCGMMVGRSPEYLNRKVETKEMKLALLTLLVHPLLILGGTAVFSMSSWGAACVLNPGSHGFSEILYELSSAAANNGSGFEGLADDTPAWNIVTGMVMLIGRFVPIILPLAIAGSLAIKKPTPETTGTFRTDTIMFGVVLLGTVIFLGALMFFPVAVLGPVAEYLSTPVY